MREPTAPHSSTMLAHPKAMLRVPPAATRWQVAGHSCTWLGAAVGIINQCLHALDRLVCHGCYRSLIDHRPDEQTDE